ncbi:MAG: hypothetical protein ABSB40_11980 [Nitrososphaeria archaeon]
MTFVTGNTSTTIDAILKEYYDDGALVNETYIDNPLWARMSKAEALGNVTGRHFVHPVVIATSQGRSRSFTQAQSRGQATNEMAYDFLVPRVTNYQLATVSTQAVLQTKGDRGAFIDILTLATDDAVRNLGLAQAHSMYGNGGEAIGQIGTIGGTSNSVITFAQADQCLNFEVQMELDAASDDGSTGSTTVAAYGTNAHGLYVIAVDRTANTITVGTAAGVACAVTDAADGIPTAADGYYLFGRGDKGLGMQGIQAWIPFGGPSSGDSFLGVTRTVDPQRLAGNWLDASSLAVEDAFITASQVVAKAGGKLTHFFVPFTKYAQLLKSQSAKVTIIEEVNPDISFDGLQVLTPKGPVLVIPDRNCPSNRMFGLNIDTWTYTHVGDPVQMFNLDGNTWLRQATADGLEIRFFSMGNLVCRVPAHNITMAC